VQQKTRHNICMQYKPSCKLWTPITKLSWDSLKLSSGTSDSNSQLKLIFVHFSHIKHVHSLTAKLIRTYDSTAWSLWRQWLWKGHSPIASLLKCNSLYTAAAEKRFLCWPFPQFLQAGTSCLTTVSQQGLLLTPWTIDAKSAVAIFEDIPTDMIFVFNYVQTALWSFSGSCHQQRIHSHR